MTTIPLSFIPNVQSCLCHLSSHPLFFVIDTSIILKNVLRFFLFCFVYLCLFIIFRSEAATAQLHSPKRQHHRASQSSCQWPLPPLPRSPISIQLPSDLSQAGSMNTAPPQLPQTTAQQKETERKIGQ